MGDVRGADRHRRHHRRGGFVGPAVPDPTPIAAPRSAHRLLLFAAFLCAICGFAYELVIIALGTVLFGSSTEQTALVLGTFVAAMGIGSWLGGRVPERFAIQVFVALEAVVAVLGGLSALALFSAYAWLDLYELAVRALSVLLGLLVGAEIPLLAAIVQWLRAERASRTVGTLLAADYVGAFVIGLTFPVLILPNTGHIVSALVFGGLNAAGGGLVLWLMRSRIGKPAWRALAAALAATAVALAAVGTVAGDIEASARQALYEDPIVHHAQTPHQEIVLTRSFDGRDLRLFLNGDLQFSSVDEYRYHEALVHPALAGRRGRVLLLGAGDGLALREVLQYPDVREAVLVELDPAILELAREHDELRRLNRDALSDARVRTVTADAFTWARRATQRFDAVIVDLPDPNDDGLAKVYSREFYEMLAARVLSPGGLIAVQAGSPYFAREAFWCVERTLRAAGLGTRPYHVDVPSFGDWGFVLAGRGRPPSLGLRPPGRLRFLDGPALAAAAAFPVDQRPAPVRPSTLDRPTIVRYARRGYRDE